MRSVALLVASAALAVNAAAREVDVDAAVAPRPGADRTGLMSAMYRRLYDGWSADDALRELIDGGYGYHSIWRNIQKYVRNADLEELRAAIDAP